MPVRLKLPRLEEKPKEIIVAPTFRDPAKLSEVDEFAIALDHIRRCIANGTPLPSRFYSKRAGLEPDAMLANYGLMHLHLGRWNTNELLWLVQYPAHVVLLELSDHQPFATQPPGVRFHAFHGRALQLKETEIDRKTATRLAEGIVSRTTLHERVRAGLLKRPRKPEP